MPSQAQEQALPDYCVSRRPLPPSAATPSASRLRRCSPKPPGSAPRALDVPLCKICRYREAEDDLLIVAGYGWDAGVVGLVVSRADETSPQGRAYTTGQPVIIRDLREANDYILPCLLCRARHRLDRRRADQGRGRRSLRRAGDRQPGAADLRRARRGLPDRLRQRAGRGGGDRRTQALLLRTVEAMEVVAAEKDKLLAERDILAEELKHRVRNNLQLVHAMLASHLKLAVGATPRPPSADLDAGDHPPGRDAGRGLRAVARHRAGPARSTWAATSPRSAPACRGCRPRCPGRDPDRPATPSRSRWTWIR